LPAIRGIRDKAGYATGAAGAGALVPPGAAMSCATATVQMLSATAFGAGQNGMRTRS
jgi:hypothetical protein